MEPVKMDNKRKWASGLAVFALICESSVFTFDSVRNGSFGLETRNIIQAIFWVALTIFLLISVSRKESQEQLNKNFSKKFIILLIVIVVIFAIFAPILVGLLK
ncbi:MAG: hypothetical protein WAN61_01365 [Minisyncoccia bacterium]